MAAGRDAILQLRHFDVDGCYITSVPPTSVEPQLETNTLSFSLLPLINHSFIR